MLGQSQGGVPVESQGPQAGLGLRHGIDDLTGDLDSLPSHRELSLIHVDVDPPQAEQLTAAQVGDAGQVPQRVQRMHFTLTSGDGGGE